MWKLAVVAVRVIEDNSLKNRDRKEGLGEKSGENGEIRNEEKKQASGNGRLQLGGWARPRARNQWEQFWGSDKSARRNSGVRAAVLRCHTVTRYGKSN